MKKIIMFVLRLTIAITMLYFGIKGMNWMAGVNAIGDPVLGLIVAFIWGISFASFAGSFWFWFLILPKRIRKSIKATVKGLLDE